MKYMNFKEVFIFVSGATPQIITETIYALSISEKPVHPEEIHIITTSAGRKRIEDTLIKGGILDNLINDYQLPDIELTEDSFIIAKDTSNNEIEDIKTETENEAIGNLITSFVREQSMRDDVRLHCSLAGGKKDYEFLYGSSPSALWKILG